MTTTTDITAITDTDLSDLLDGIAGRLHGEHTADIAYLFDIDITVVSVVLQLGIAIAFERLEVAAAVDESLRTHLAALMRFVFDNPQTEFYRSPDYKEKLMPDNNDRDPAKVFGGWDPDWMGPGTGTSAPRDPNRVRPPLRWKSDNPFPPPPWSETVYDYAPVKVARIEQSVPDETAPWPPPTTEQENP